VRKRPAKLSGFLKPGMCLGVRGFDETNGTHVRGKVNRGPEDEYRLALSIGLGKQSRFQGDDADVVLTDMLDIRMTLAPRKPRRVRYSSDARCNISLQSVPAEERSIQSR
jgi:hypothetical protein